MSYMAVRRDSVRLVFPFLYVGSREGTRVIKAAIAGGKLLYPALSRQPYFNSLIVKSYRGFFMHHVVSDFLTELSHRVVLASLEFYIDQSCL